MYFWEQSEKYRDAASRTPWRSSPPTVQKTRYVPLLSAERTGCSATRLPVQRPARWSTALWKLQRQTALCPEIISSFPHSAITKLPRAALGWSFNGSLQIFFGALEGTRIPGPLIKRAPRAGYSDFETFEFTLFLCKASWFSARQFLHSLSYFASQSTPCNPWNSAKTVQKPCTYSGTNEK